jgi:hypothetical protein
MLHIPKNSTALAAANALLLTSCTHLTLLGALQPTPLTQGDDQTTMHGPPSPRPQAAMALASGAAVQRTSPPARQPLTYTPSPTTHPLPPANTPAMWHERAALVAAIRRSDPLRAASGTHLLDDEEVLLAANAGRFSFGPPGSDRRRMLLPGQQQQPAAPQLRPCHLHGLGQPEQRSFGARQEGTSVAAENGQQADASRQRQAAQAAEAQASRGAAVLYALLAATLAPLPRSAPHRMLSPLTPGHD